MGIEMASAARPRRDRLAETQSEVGAAEPSPGLAAFESVQRFVFALRAPWFGSSVDSRTAGLGKLSEAARLLMNRETEELRLRRHPAFRHPHRLAAFRRTHALEAGWGKAAHADLERVTGPHRDLLTEEQHGFAERIGLHDSGLPNALGPGADRELKSGQ